MINILHERKIAEHESLILTDKAIIKEEKNFFGDLIYSEIPIKKINSIKKEVSHYKIIIVFSIVFLISAALSIYKEKDIVLIISLLITGIVLFALYLFTGKKEICIKSGNIEITEYAGGCKEFVKELRSQIYSNSNQTGQ